MVTKRSFGEVVFDGSNGIKKTDLLLKSMETISLGFTFDKNPTEFC